MLQSGMCQCPTGKGDSGRAATAADSTDPQTLLLHKCLDATRGRRRASTRESRHRRCRRRPPPRCDESSGSAAPRSVEHTTKGRMGRRVIALLLLELPPKHGLEPIL
jgi:hypothetical protein